MNNNDIPLLSQPEYYCDEEEIGNDYFNNCHYENNYNEQLRYITKSTKDIDPTSVIVCISSCTTYDDAYRNVNEKDNEKIDYFVIGYKKISEFYKIIVENEETNNSEYKKLKKSLEIVSSDSVMVYFECCSFLENIKFHFTEKCIELIEYFIFNKKYLVLCADFSLKCLINDWNEEKFGKTPFSGYSSLKKGTIDISFKKEKFINSGLRQFKVLGELVDHNKQTGKILLKVLEDTISFKINNTQDDKYTIDILSIITEKTDDKYDNINHSNKKQKTNNIINNTLNTLSNACTLCNVNENKVNDELVINEDSLVAHAIINFKDGGKLLLSNGHFSELSRINCSDESLETTITSVFGSSYLNNYKKKIENAETQEQIDHIKTSEINCVMSQTVSN